MREKALQNVLGCFPFNPQKRREPRFVSLHQWLRILEHETSSSVLRIALSLSLVSMQRLESIVRLSPSSIIVKSENYLQVVIHSSKQRGRIAIAYAVKKQETPKVVFQTLILAHKRSWSLRRGPLVSELRRVSVRAIGFPTTFHNIRRSLAVAQVRRGVPPAVVQALGDWKSAESFHRYLDHWLRSLGGINLKRLL